jgi:phage tail tube protein FII
MKRQIILSFVFAFSLFVNLPAQEASTKRQTPVADLMNQRNGEVIDYQKTLRRFETAFKEGDQASMSDLKEDLVAAMQKRIDLLEAEPPAKGEQQNELKQQKEILSAVKEYDYGTMKQGNEASMSQVRMLQQFAQLMEKNYVTQ